LASKAAFFEEKTRKKFKNAQNRNEKRPNSPVFTPKSAVLEPRCRRKNQKLNKKQKNSTKK